VAFGPFAAEASHEDRSAGVAPCLRIHRERVDKRAALSARLERQAAFFVCVRFGGIGGTITSDYVCRGTVSAPREELLGRRPSPNAREVVALKLSPFS
jgi:hypothetical protein